MNNYIIVLIDSKNVHEFNIAKQLNTLKLRNIFTEIATTAAELNGENKPYNDKVNMLFKKAHELLVSSNINDLQVLSDAPFRGFTIKFNDNYLLTIKSISNE